MKKKFSITFLFALLLLTLVSSAQADILGDRIARELCLGANKANQEYSLSIGEAANWKSDALSGKATSNTSGKLYSSEFAKSSGTNSGACTRTVKITNVTPSATMCDKATVELISGTTILKRSNMQNIPCR